MSLRANLVAAIVTSLAAMVLTLILLEDPLVEHRQTAIQRDELLEAARSAASAIDEGDGLDAAADRIGALTATRITILDAHGNVLGDTALDDEDLDGAAREAHSEIAEARTHGSATATRRDADREDDTPVLYAAIRASGGRVVRAARPLSSIEAARRSTRELLILGGVIAGLSVLLLTLVLSRTLVRPIEELTRSAAAIAEGDLRRRIRSNRTDELGHLGRALDDMADELSSQLVEIRMEEGRLSTVLDSMAEAVFVTDPTGVVVLTNKTLDALVGSSARGMTVVEALDAPDLHEAVWAAMRGETSSVDLDVKVGDRELALAAHVAPLPELRGVVGVLHDVTGLKRADKIRRDFVANASHELRTPLTAIRGFAETLRGGAATDPDTANRFLDTILRHTTRLQRLVDDLLALSRSESADQEIELGPTDVGAIARDAARYLEANAQKKEIVVRLEGFAELPPAQASEWAFDHVMVNLIDNAVKYTPSAGTVTVRGGCDGDRVTVEVSDTGPGIPLSKQSRIFERFYRIDKGRSRDQGGTGLGLSIVKHLVQRMNGSITVESQPGAGATFRVTLPRAASAAPTATATAPASAEVPAGAGEPSPR